MHNKLNKIAIIGGGSWATAIVKMLADNIEEKEIYWWMRDESAVSHIAKYKHNPKYLSSVELKVDANKVSTDIKAIIKAADMILLNVPAAFLKQAFEGLTIEDFKGKKIISAIKGIVPDENQIIGEFIHDKYDIPFEDIIVISGPCHAEEVALEKLSYLTIACQDLNLASRFSKLINTRYNKTNISDDIYGTEYSAVLKNIYAVASGICHGVGFGDNFQAVLMSNAIREMKHFIKKVHKMKRNINNSAYLGDLLVTGYSLFSRNRQFGNMVGKGYTVKSAQIEMSMIAEGFYATKSAFKITKDNKACTPIIDAVYQVLYGGKNPKKEFKKLTNKLN